MFFLKLVDMHSQPANIYQTKNVIIDSGQLIIAGIDEFFMFL